MKHLLIAALPNSPALYWTYLKSPQKFSTPTVQILCLKLRGHWTESHQVSTGCTEMTANYSAEIRIAIFQSVAERQCDEWRSSSNCVGITAKIARLNSVNPEIIGRKFTKFGNNVVGLLPFSRLRADLWSANRLSNAKAKNIGINIPTITPTKPVK